MRTVLLSLLAGCVPGPWGPCAVTAEGPPEFQEAALEAVSAWDGALYAACGRAVLLLAPEGGRPLRLVEGGLPSGEVGLFDGDTADVLAGMSYAQTRAAAVHELGHALGLDHVAVGGDPRSVMHPAVNGYLWRPTEGDVRLAAAALGCPL